MDKSQTASFFKLMEKHVFFYTELRDFENLKMHDIYENHFEKLDDYVKKEEAFVLQARGLEAAREKLFVESALTDMKMREIIDTLPDEDKEKGTELYDSLCALTEEIKSINKKCMSMSELRMHRLRQIIDRFESKSEAENGKKTAPASGKKTLSAKI